MKRTPLIRRTPLKRGTSQLKRSPLKKMSTRKKGFMAQYWKLCAKDGKTPYMDRHHIFGREGIYLLAYLLIPSWQHIRIHGGERKQAMREGWLQPPYEGKPMDWNWPRPWDAAYEKDWPEELKRKS